MFAYVDRDPRIGYVNKAFADGYELDRQRVFGASIAEVLGEELFGQIRPAITRAQSGQRVTHEAQSIRSNGVLQRWRATLIPQHGGTGWVVGYLVYCEDITQRHVAEQNLVKAKGEAERMSGFLDAIINVVPAPVFVKDDQFRFVVVNAGLCRLVGQSREQLLGRTDYDFFFKEQADFCRARDSEVLAATSEHAVEEPVTDRDGVIHWLLTRKRAVQLAGGRRLLVGVINDIAARRSAEDSLRQSEERFRGGGFHSEADRVG